ncbi:MAG: hypothetical protein M9962_12890 [Oligoflexia bacterium]|nr:hypothetical protein [Oligoflexia bacterium]
MSRKSSFLKIFINCLLSALLTILFCFLLLEGYLRWSGYLNAQPANYPCMGSDDILNHAFRKDCEQIAKAADLKTEKDVTYKTNSLGTRGPMPLEKSAKLLLLGDSYTEGFGLEEFESLTAQIQKHLDGKQKNVQVLNGGTMGYTASLYPLYYERFFSSFKPNYVLVQVDFSDFNDEGYYLQIADYSAENVPQAFPWRDPISSYILNIVYSNASAALRFLHSEFTQARLALGRAKMKGKMDAYVNQGPRLISEPWLKEVNQDQCWKTYEAVAKGLIRLKALVEANDGKMGIHMYPPGTEIKTIHSPKENFSFVQIIDRKLRSDYSWACGVNHGAVAVFRKFAKVSNLDFYDSFPFVLSQPDKEKFYFDNDAHWNSYGVRKVAAHLSIELSKKLKDIRATF